MANKRVREEGAESTRRRRVRRTRTDDGGSVTPGSRRNSNNNAAGPAVPKKTSETTAAAAAPAGSRSRSRRRAGRPRPTRRSEPVDGLTDGAPTARPKPRPAPAAPPPPTEPEAPDIDGTTTPAREVRGSEANQIKNRGGVFSLIISTLEVPGPLASHGRSRCPQLRMQADNNHARGMTHEDASLCVRRPSHVGSHACTRHCPCTHTRTLVLTNKRTHAHIAFPPARFGTRNSFPDAHTYRCMLKRWSWIKYFSTPLVALASEN